MWEQESFALRSSPDHGHYLMWLGLGLCVWGLSRPLESENYIRMRTIFVFLFACVIGFFASTSGGLSFFVFFSALTICFMHSLGSAREAVGLTVILYICRPWEVLPANDWWSQVPRQCIWLWLFALLRELSLSQRKFQDFLVFSRGTGASLLLGIWCLLTTFVSRDPAGSQQYFVDTLFRALTLILILHLTVQTASDVTRLHFAFVIGVVTLALFSLWKFKGLDQIAPFDLLVRTSGDAERRLEAVGSLGNSNDIAAVILIPLGSLWPMFLSGRARPLTQLVCLFIAFFLLQALMASQSRGALMATAAQAGLMVVARSKNPKRLALLLLVVVGVVGAFANQMLGRNADDLDASTESRMNYYVTGLYMALNSPIWGQGFGRYPYEFERFSPLILHEWGLRTAHSSWILVLAETGIVGLLLFGFVHLHIVRACWVARDQVPAFLLSFVGYSITIVFLSHSWLMFPWILFTLTDLYHKFSQHSVALQKRRGDA